MKKRIFITLLAALLCLSAVSCSTPAEQTGTDDTIADTTIETVETEAKPDLPEKDYEGFAYRILTNEAIFCPRSLPGK